VQGAKYIVTSGMAGDWAAYAEHDVAEYTGNGWVKVTPAADCGWVAYVADEDIYYRFTASAWVAETGTTSVAGMVRLADAAAMEALTASRVVTADVQLRHPTHPKLWGTATAAGAISADYGISSVVDDFTGTITWNYDTAFSASTYCGLTSAKDNSGGVRDSVIVTAAVSSCQVTTRNASAGLSDPDGYYIGIMGDQ
jgi:hypothetical protein